VGRKVHVVPGARASMNEDGVRCEHEAPVT
jgi:hypothetical protein